MCSDDDYESVICETCNGSGEGMHDGSTCRTCRGTGEVWVKVEDDEDEDHADCDG